ncbi:uncharacterized protein LOC131587145 [Poecile atricapillus]|uniref:uncharacterized protein LOC131587145 n=1 Tax=Poecile atricapillus TaxID=48891 RepID=UPI002739C085|nr:uncharacterized protein LOC131587145 [Poecile atricapillus]
MGAVPSRCLWKEEGSRQPPAPRGSLSPLVPSPPCIPRIPFLPVWAQEFDRSYRIKGRMSEPALCGQSRQGLTSWPVCFRRDLGTCLESHLKQDLTPLVLRHVLGSCTDHPGEFGDVGTGRYSETLEPLFSSVPAPHPHELCGFLSRACFPWIPQRGQHQITKRTTLLPLPRCPGGSWGSGLGAKLDLLQRAAEFARKPREREGKSWPVESRSKEPTHPSKLQTGTSPPAFILAPVKIQFNTELPHIPLQPLLWWGSPAPTKILFSFGKPLLAGLHGHRGELRLLIQAFGAGEVPPGK